jgi:hypothetical protein
MNQDYVDTVRLLLAVAPAVFRRPRFALKGGTALNLFVQDMPRLSVDIDVVFTDHTLDREAALKAIAADLKSIKSAISAPAKDLKKFGAALLSRRPEAASHGQQQRVDESPTAARVPRRCPRAISRSPSSSTSAWGRLWVKSCLSPGWHQFSHCA